MTGQRGGNVTLPFNLPTQNDLSIVLTSGSKYASGVRQDPEYKGRVHRSGTSDLVLQGLKTTDAKTFNLKIYDNGQLIFNSSCEVHVTCKVKTD